MKSGDDDAFTARLSEYWRAWATAKGLDPDRPTKAGLRQCYIARSPALVLREDSAYWHLFLDALARHGYVAEV
jgi:hypothetical protein